jgi:hypothetical protein
VPHAKRCGFGAFGDGPVTDHRWGHLDLDLAGCFRGSVTAIEHLAGRSLHSKSPKAIAKYRELVHKHLCSHNTFKRIERLETIACDDWTHTNEIELNKIDDRISEAMLDAEAKACTHRNLPWSPALKAAQIGVECWLKIISSIKNKTNYRVQLERLVQKLPQSSRAGHQLDKVHPLHEAQTNLRAARRQRHTVMSQATECRSMFLHEQAAAAALESDDDKEAMLKRLMQPDKNAAKRTRDSITSSNQQRLEPSPI